MQRDGLGEQRFRSDHSGGTHSLFPCDRSPERGPASAPSASAGAGLGCGPERRSPGASLSWRWRWPYLLDGIKGRRKGRMGGSKRQHGPQSRMENVQMNAEKRLNKVIAVSPSSSGQKREPYHAIHMTGPCPPCILKSRVGTGKFSNHRTKRDEKGPSAQGIRGPSEPDWGLRGPPPLDPPQLLEA